MRHILELSRREGPGPDTAIDMYRIAIFYLYQQAGIWQCLKASQPQAFQAGYTKDLPNMKLSTLILTRFFPRPPTKRGLSSPARLQMDWFLPGRGHR